MVTQLPNWDEKRDAQKCRDPREYGKVIGQVSQVSHESMNVEIRIDRAQQIRPKPNGGQQGIVTAEENGPQPDGRRLVQPDNL